MGKHKTIRQPFQLTGTFLGFVVKNGFKVKGLRLDTPSGEHYIKLTKAARASCSPLPTLGAPIRVSGEQKIDQGEQTVRFKADQVAILAPHSAADATHSVTMAPLAAPPPKSQKAAAKPCILVCRKSDCCKRGGREVIAGLRQELGDRQLAEQVVIRETGCMKKCKAGPNLVMPDKTRHSRVRPQDIPALLDQYGLDGEPLAG